MAGLGFTLSTALNTPYSHHVALDHLAMSKNPVFYTHAMLFLTYTGHISLSKKVLCLPLSPLLPPQGVITDLMVTA